MITFGILIAYLVGFLLKDAADNWRWMLRLGAVPGLALATSMIFVPRSGCWRSAWSGGAPETKGRSLEQIEREVGAAAT